MVKKPTEASKLVYVKVTLNYITPPIWRRLRVPVSWHLGKLNQAILKVLEQPDIKARLAEQGSEPAGNSPDEFRRFIGTELEKWRGLVKISGAKVE